MSRRRVVLAAGSVLLIAFAIRVTIGTLSPTMIWPDEIYQSLEQAHRLVWGYGIVPWEFRLGARSWMLPGLLALTMRLTAWMHAGSLGYLTAIRVELCLLSLAIPLAAFALAEGTVKRRDGASLRAAVVAGFVPALWFELVYFAPKALGESVAAAPLVVGLVLLEKRDRSSSGKTLFWTGFFLALSVALRIQLVVAVALVVVISMVRIGTLGWRPFLAGFALPILFAGGLDFATWGSPFQSYVQNVVTNVGAAGRSTRYGFAPWYGYAVVLGRVWGWTTPVLLVLACFGARRAPLVAVAAVVTFVTHVVFAHKEYRFLVPTLALMTMLAGVGLASICVWCEERLPPREIWGSLVAVLAVFTWGTLSLVRAGSYDWIATSMVGLSGEPPFMWHHFRGSLEAFQALSEEPNVCGVGLADRGWNMCAGYSYLHQNVPIFELTSEEVYARYFASFNVMLVHSTDAPTLGAFHLEQCFDSECIYRRDGGCTPYPGYDFNAYLAAHNL